MITTTWSNILPMNLESMAGFLQVQTAQKFEQEPDLDFCRCEGECEFEELALVLTGGTVYQNDLTSFLNGRRFLTDTITYALLKDDVQVAVLNSNTYGTYYDFGSLLHGDYKGFIVEWLKVKDGFGHGNYKVKTTISSLGVDYVKTSHTYKVIGYTPEIADQTVRIEAFQNGYYRMGVDYSGENWYQSIRIPGKFWNKQPELIVNNYNDTARNIHQIQDEIQYTYDLVTHLQDSFIYNFLVEELLRANRILITDYNIKNQEVYRRKAVYNHEIAEAVNHKFSIKANHVFKFKERQENRLKSNTSNVEDKLNFPLISTMSCPVGSVHNSNDSYTANVTSGGTLALPDIDVNANGAFVKTSPSVIDVNVDVVNSNDDPVGTPSGGKQNIGDTGITVNTTPFGSTPAETDFDVPVINSDLDPVGSKVGSDWKIGDALAQVNGNDFDTVPAEGVLDIPVVDTDDVPVGVIETSPTLLVRVPAGVTPSGIQFHDPLPDQYTSYRTGDVGDRVQNAYWPTYTKPLNPAAIAELDYTSANYWFKLANALTVDGVSNTTRFVDVDGGQTFSATGNKNYAFLDKLTGFLVVRDTTALSALSWNNAIDNALSNSIVIDGVTYSGWYLASVSEANDIFGVFANNGNWVDPITSNTIGVFQFGSHWLSRTDPTATTQANYMQFSSGIPFIFSQAKTTATRPIWIHKAHNLISA